MSQQQQDQTELASLTKLVGESIIPGGSLLAAGKMREGLLHLAGGLVARAIFGVPGLFLVRANALSNSYSGKHLHRHFVPSEKEQAQQASAVDVTPASDTTEKP